MTSTQSPADVESASPEATSGTPADEGEVRGGTGLLFLAALLGVLGFFGGVHIVIVVVSLVIMIFMHELGHYLAARRAGMKVTEFFIGFGPTLWSFQRGETEYGFKAIPAGAYVRVIGMNNLEEVDPSEEHRTYRQGRYRDRMLLAVAGSAMHFLMALVMLFVLIAGWGIDQDDTAWSVIEVAEAGPAEAMGIEVGDQLVSIDGQPASSWEDMVTVVDARPGEQVQVEVNRGGEVVTLQGTLGENAEGNGRLGVTRSQFDRIDVGLLDAVPRTGEVFGDGVVRTVGALGDLFSPSGLQNFFSTVFSGGDGNDGEGISESEDERIVSIVGAARLGGELTEDGFDGLLSFMVLINIFVGVFNLVPLLPLDGGHVAVATYEKVREIQTKQRRYFVDAAKLLPLTYAVLFVLLAVGVSAIYLDIADPISL